MKANWKRWTARIGLALALVIVAVAAQRYLLRDPLGDAVTGGNGRIEATEIDIAAKAPGRVRTILAREGQAVRAGEVVATIDAAALEAQRAQALAQMQAAASAVATAEAQVAQALGQRAAALAQIRQREADLGSARRHLGRSTELAAEGATPRQEQEDDRARVQSAQAALDAARAQLAALDAAVATARAQVGSARANVEAAQAAIRRLDADLGDATLRAPRDGRVQYRIAEPGEVVAAGGKLLSLIDLSDVYLTFFLPAEAAGRVGIGDEARIVLDSAPDRVFPARISFVADVAQFTPKTVETKDERQKLMFRVRAAVDPALAARIGALVKPGMPGMAYVRTDPARPWPARLAISAAR